MAVQVWTKHGQFPIPRSARGQSRAADDRARLSERGRRRILTFVPESRRNSVSDYQSVHGLLTPLHPFELCVSFQRLVDCIKLHQIPCRGSSASRNPLDPRYALGPAKTFCERSANNTQAPTAPTAPTTCTNCRLIASSTGCAAVGFHGGVRRCKHGFYAAQYDTILSAPAILETLSPKRAL
jgi:hypothetical protein